MLASFHNPPPPRTDRAFENPISYFNGAVTAEYFSTSTGPHPRYFTRQTLPPPPARPGSATTNVYRRPHGPAPGSLGPCYPPAHYHLFQTETFRVVSGTGRWHIRDETKTLSAGEEISIPVRAWHCFENTPNSQDPLVIEIALSPALDGSEGKKEERMFRNLWGYLDDCRKAKRRPDPFQINVFLWEVRAPTALGVPGPEWANLLVSTVMMMVMVFVGRVLLGLKPSYQEYYSEAEDGSNEKKEL